MALSRNQIAYALVVCVNVAIPPFVLWKRYSGEISSTAAILSAALSAAMLNAVLVSSLRFKQRRLEISPPHHLRATAVALAMTVVLLTALGMKAIPVRNDYLRLALSDKPLSEIQPERKRLVVEVIRRRATNSRENDLALAEAKAHPISPALYTPESFASVDVMHGTIETLKKCIEMDREYGAKQRMVMSDFREKMATVDPEYLRQWDSKRQDEEQLEASVTELEEQWFSGVVALYEYAAAHQNEVKLYGGPVEPADKVMQDFKEQLAASKALYARWQERFQELVKRHNEAVAHSTSDMP